MSERLRSLRWRIASRIAPYPIMHDPGMGRSGQMIVTMGDGARIAMRLKSFRMKSSLPSFDGTPRRSGMWFVGVADRGWDDLDAANEGVR